MPRIAIIAGSFHKERVESMVAEARSVADSIGIEIANEIWVPGSFEVPLALQHVLKAHTVDGAIVLGIIERGETKHGLVMAQSVFPKVMDLQLQTKKPVGIGIIGPEVLEEQIDPRLLPHARAAVEAVHAMLEILKKAV